MENREAVVIRDAGDASVAQFADTLAGRQYHVVAVAQKFGVMGLTLAITCELALRNVM
jgi:hypothetical protein